MSEQQPTTPPDNEPRPRRRRQRQISSFQIAFAAILSVGLLMVINFSGRIARGQQMENARVRLQATIDVLEVEQRALLQQKEYAASSESVREWAHTEGKMVQDDEILVIPIPAITSLASFYNRDGAQLFTLRDIGIPSTANAGRNITIDMWWTASSVPPDDYTLAVMLVNADNQIVSDNTRLLLGDSLSTSKWEANALKTDAYRLPIPATLPSGTYRLRLAMYRQASDQPLAVRMTDDPPDVDPRPYADMGSIRVIAEDTEPETPRWQLWWNLFFDSDPPF
jgi:hypothetical protein